MKSDTSIRQILLGLCLLAALVLGLAMSQGLEEASSAQSVIGAQGGDQAPAALAKGNEP